MNILYINHYAGSPAYGMEYRPYYLAREWVREGHRVTIVAASYSHLRRRQPRSAGPITAEVVDGVRFVWCRTPGYRGNGLGRVVNIFAFLYHLARDGRWLDMKPDYVIASSTYPLDIYPARGLARQHGARLVWEVHDLWPLSPIELGGMSRRHPFIALLQRAEDTACRDADVVVSLLPKAGEYLHSRGMALGKFVHIPNGIEAAEWCDHSISDLPKGHAEVVRAARDKGRLLVAYAGAHGAANALGSLLDAAALTRRDPVTFFLVGSGPEKAALQARVAAEGLENVVLLDPVPKTSIPALLRAMDVLYIGLQRQPLFRFGISPNKLMDYMMAARPVVCAIDAGNDPVAESGCGITVEPENPVALASAVRRLAAMAPAERQALGDAGRRFVEREHLYSVLAGRFIHAMQAPVK